MADAEAHCGLFRPNSSIMGVNEGMLRCPASPRIHPAPVQHAGNLPDDGLRVLTAAETLADGGIRVDLAPTRKPLSDASLFFGNQAPANALTPDTRFQEQCHEPVS